MASLNEVNASIAGDEVVADIPILQRNGEPYLAADGVTPATIGVLGSESKAVRSARDKITKRNIKNRRMANVTPEELRASRVEQAAAAVVRWTGWELDGSPWPCTSENVKQLLAADHILAQVETGVDAHADFFATPSLNSAST